MSQHDMDLLNQNGAAFRADLNNAIKALVSVSSGATEPATRFPGMLWLDTSVAPNGQLKQRNLSNTAWVNPSIPIAWNGGTITGAIMIAPVSGFARLQLQKPTTADGCVVEGFDEAGKLTWRMYLGTGTAADDFNLNRYDNTGAFVGTVLSINRVSGLLTLSNGLSVTAGGIDMNTSKVTELGTPTADADATTKLYVDTAITAAVSGIASITDAPADGNSYGRKDATWIDLDTIFATLAQLSALASQVTALGLEVDTKLDDAPNDGKQYARQALAWAELLPPTGIDEAPIDGSPYSRQDAGWISAAGVGGVEEAPVDGGLYARHDGLWDDITGDLFSDAPIDGTPYSRQDGTWVAAASGGASDWDDITDKPATFPPSTHTHSYASLTGIPSTFAPSAHSHPTSEVTGLDAALAAKAPLASPAFSGNPTAPTPTAGDNDTSIATTAFVAAAVAAGGGGGGGIPDAPTDNMFYARQDAAWVDLNTAYVSFTYLDIVIDSLPEPGISDAPNDGNTYVRRSASWAVTPKITVGTAAPGSPAVNDLWVDTN